ncbi:unnamed protein product [Orchesella dallaii]|uniref:Pyrroloquinoline quinone-dependent pyranose dehydrogenase beta-propeller domain-containing protein n=1 Tax=Orchesella dallaii TaxID=48710 RepID=A0ABP1PRL5_9HEXA
MIIIGGSCLAWAVKCQVDYNTTEGFTADRFINTNEVKRPRGILLDPVGDILIVSGKPYSEITTVYKDHENKTVKTVLVNGERLGLTHGIAYNAGYLYASSDTTVYRWPYSPGQRSALGENYEIIIKNIPAGGHETRTLVFDSYNSLYISVGSFANVSLDSDRARILKFNLGQGIQPGGFEYSSGEVYAEGLRNAVGLAFYNAILWAVDNGADDLVRDDIEKDINNSNPADELIKLDKPPGSFYGYPYCWTVYDLPKTNNGRGDQLAWPGYLEDGVHNDAWCNQSSNSIPPTLPLPAHYAPLGLTFYDGTGCDTTGTGAFPCTMKGDAFVAFHGSWNNNPQRGFQVARIPINHETGVRIGEEPIWILREIAPNSCNPCLRPVDLVFDQHGHLIVTSDASGDVIRVMYENGDLDPEPTSSTPGTKPSPTPGPNSVGKLQLSGMLVILMAFTVIQRQYS